MRQELNADMKHIHHREDSNQAIFDKLKQKLRKAQNDSTRRDFVQDQLSETVSSRERLQSELESRRSGNKASRQQS